MKSACPIAGDAPRGLSPASREIAGRPESMSHSLPKSLACPAHKIALDERLFCPVCDKAYPSMEGVPILINDASSVFRIADYLDRNAYGGASAYGGHLDEHRGLRRVYRRAMNRLSESASPIQDYDVDRAVDRILSSNSAAEILVIGSGDTTIRGNATYTDVAFGANVQCIADAHDLPFLAQSFDACIAVAVLEHVADPYRCVSEIMRVLRPGGHVYAETPFMQPVHMREYDFTRFTYLGHRRLFRYFEEIRSGIAGGPGASAGQLLRQAIASLSDRPGAKRWLRLFGMLSAYPLRWLDRACSGKLGAYDSASAFYFFGTLRNEPISDRELLGLFRGA